MPSRIWWYTQLKKVIFTSRVLYAILAFRFKNTQKCACYRLMDTVFMSNVVKSAARIFFWTLMKDIIQLKVSKMFLKITYICKSPIKELCPTKWSETSIFHFVLFLANFFYTFIAHCRWSLEYTDNIRGVKPSQIYAWLIDFNGMSTRLELFFA